MGSKNTVKSIETIINKNVINKLKSKVPLVIDIIMRTYDSNLNGIVLNKKSKTRPENYQDLFLSRLEKYPFIKTGEKGPIFSIPEMDTFDFKGGLEVIKIICEGLTGIYVVVTGEEYKKALGKEPQTIDTEDEDAPREERIYLLRITDPKKNKIEKVLGKELPRYEFSNFPPQDVFRDVNKIVEEELPIWIDDAISEVIKATSSN